MKHTTIPTRIAVPLGFAALVALAFPFVMAACTEQEPMKPGYYTGSRVGSSVTMGDWKITYLGRFDTWDTGQREVLEVENLKTGSKNLMIRGFGSAEMIYKNKQGMREE